MSASASRPTQAQLEAGNYPKTRTTFQGLPVTIENPRGSTRSGVSKGGHKWSTKMLHDYGYIRGTLGVDGDHYDVYLGPDQEADTAYLVTTMCPPDFTRPDEQKAMLGFNSEAEARAAYLAHYDNPGFCGPIKAMPMARFKQEVMTTRERPRMLKSSPILMLLKAKIPGAHTSSLFDTTVDVAAHVTKQGTYVAPYRAHRKVLLTQTAKKPPAASSSDSSPDLFSVAAPPEKPKVVPKAAEPDLFAPRQLPEPAKTDVDERKKPAATKPEAPDEDLAKPNAPPESTGSPDLSAGPEPTTFGVPAGTSKKERRAANRAALDILREHPSRPSPEQRRSLARYTGRGGIGDSLNEFYTDPAVAKAMWSILATLGWKGGDVLEPSCGTGVFLHTAPPGTRVTGVELDPDSAAISSILHSEHETENASFERFSTQDGRQFGAVIGNVPFGPRGSTIGDDKKDLAKADQYFLDTALDKTVDGGLVALIVPTGIMDSSSGRSFRERIMRKGEFLGAIRLPNTAFEAAHTEVTSDIVVFRKRPQEVAGALFALDQKQIQALGVWDAEFLSGSYFTDGRGAKNVMGQLEPGWRAKAGIGDDITVTGSMAGVPAAVAAWQPDPPATALPSMHNILDLVGDDERERRRVVSAALKNPYQLAHRGDIKVVDGIRYILQGDPPRWHRTEGDVPDAVLGAHEIGALLEKLGADGDHADTRAALVEAMDEWVKEHGLPSGNRDLRAWLAAPNLPAGHTGAADDYLRTTARILGTVQSDGSYSDAITGRTSAAPGAGLDTAALRLALDHGGFTVDELAGATGRPTADVLDHLFAVNSYAVDADGKTWNTMDGYVSGDLWPKLDAVQAAMAHSGMGPEYRAKYEAQAKALEAAIDPQSLEDVEITVGSGFISPEVLTAFFADKHRAWREKNPDSAWSPPAVRVTYDDGLYLVSGTSMGGEGDLLERILNRSGVRKDEIDDVAELNAEFKDWLLQSSYRESVEDNYNRTHRGFRAPIYSDAAMAIPGLNPALDINSYHFSGLRWALATGKGIVADDVGLGKTIRGLMLAKLAKLEGKKKPTIVVPKSVLANWLESADFWFPGSRILTIGETYTKDKDGNITSKADDAATRERKYQEYRQNEYDFVFISQPAWNDLDVDPITKGKYVNDEFWTKRGDKMAESKGKERTEDKRLAKIRTAYDQAIAKRDFANREDTVFFNDLGCDMLIFDEGHSYKNLFSARNRFGENPKFLGGSGESNRALDTYFKTRSLRDANGGKGVFLLTATPTKNSPLEVYSMLAHIAPEAFERMGIKNSEDFLDRFCAFEREEILGTDGKIKEALVTAGFKNMNELREVMRRYIDRRTAADVGLKIPSADRIQHTVTMTPEQESIYEKLRALAAEKKGSDATGDAHIFSIMSKMGKASLDLRLLGIKGSRSPKIDELVKTTLAHIPEGGQVVFCDSVDVHDMIAAAMASAGVPRSRVGIMNATTAASGAARQKMAEDFNSGKLDVLIGNTAVMGEGVNLQKRTTDIHHLDMAWEPSSMHQREGRGVRQGNKNAKVRVHGYLAKGSFDGYRWQTIAAKKDWQDLLWNGGDTVENMAREGAGSRQDMLIMLSADPEAERAKYESNKTEAIERRDAEETGKALEDFAKLQKMRASFGAIGARDGGGPAAHRLRIKSEQLAAALAANKWFKHKDLLSSGVPALIEPVTNQAWHAGKALVLEPGSGSPIHYSSQPTKWVVTNVDPRSSSVDMRPYGDLLGKEITLSLESMNSGVHPAEYSAESEPVAPEGAGDVDIADLHKLAPGTLERIGYDKVQARLKKSILDYTGGSHEHFGVVDRAGTPRAIASHGVRNRLGDHDLILPTEAGRKAAIQGYVDSTLGRTIAASYSNRGTIPTAKYDHGDTYSSPPGKNPWEKVIQTVHGHHVLEQAKSEVISRVHAKISQAASFPAAADAAQPALAVGGHEYTHRAWPVPVVRALYAKAKAFGVLDQPMGEASGLKPLLLGVKPRSNGSLMNGSLPVGHFLLSLLPRDDAKVLEDS